MGDLRSKENSALPLGTGQQVERTLDWEPFPRARSPIERVLVIIVCPSHRSSLIAHRPTAGSSSPAGNRLSFSWRATLCDRETSVLPRVKAPAPLAAQSISSGSFLRVPMLSVLFSIPRQCAPWFFRLASWAPASMTCPVLALMGHPMYVIDAF